MEVECKGMEGRLIVKEWRLNVKERRLNVKNERNDRTKRFCYPAFHSA